MTFEFARMGTVFLHLIACCVAIGLVFMSDVEMIQQLISADPKQRLDPDHLSSLQTTVLRALAALWITGIALVSLDASVKGLGYFANPKLQSKIAIVSLLTINGYALHRYILPVLQKAGSLLRLEPSQRAMAMFTGAVSGVSWFYAAMLGIGRPLNWKYSLVEILAAYPLLIAVGFTTMSLLTAWSSHKAHSQEEPMLGTL